MRSSWFVIPVAAALLAVGCGGDDGGGGSAGPADGDGTVPAGNAENCPVDALESATGKVEIDAWYAFQGLAAQSFEQMVADYNASQDKVVVKAANQGSYEEQLAKYKTALGKPETLPELVTAEDTNTRFLVDSNSIVTAEDCLAADPEAAALYEDLVPAVRAAYTVDEQLLPVGFAVSNPVLYFNQAHFRAAGLDVEQPPATLAELRETAQKLKDAGIDGLEQPLVMQMDSWFLEHWLTGERQAVVDQDNGRSGPPTATELTSPEAVEIVTWIKEMVDAGLLKPVRSNEDISAYLAVATQSGSMLIQTSAAISTIDAAISGTLTKDMLPQAGDLPLESLKFSDLEIGVAPLPGVEVAGKGQIGGNAWYLPKKEPVEIAAAWDFAKYANSVEAQVRWTQLGGYLPSHRTVAEDPRLTADWENTRKGGWLKIAYEGTLSLDPEFTGPLIGAYAAFRTEARSALDAVALQGADPATALQTAADKVATAFAEYRENPGQS